MYSIYLLVSCYVSPFKGFLSFSLFKHSSSVCVSIKYDIPAPGFKGSQIYIQTWRRVSRTLLTASQGIRAASRGCEEVMGTVGAGMPFLEKETHSHTPDQDRISEGVRFEGHCWVSLSKTGRGSTSSSQDEQNRIPHNAFLVPLCWSAVSWLHCSFCNVWIIP